MWSNDDPLYVPDDGLDNNIDHGLLQKYFDVNEIFELNNTSGDTDSSKQPEESFTSDDFPELYVSAIGKIYRLLDDNFGILRVGDNLVLFDVCDFWIDSNATASKRGLKIGQIVGLGSTVIFHACRQEDKMSKVQYLANAVWKKELEEIKGSKEFLPNPIRTHEVAEEKIRIFKQVVAAVSPTLPFFGGRRPALHVLNGKTGVVETTLVDERGVFLAGVMNVSGLGTTGQEKMRCAFVREHFKGTSVPQAGYSYMVNIRRVVRKFSWSDKVPYIALAVYPMYSNVKEEEHDKAGEKEEIAVRQFDNTYHMVVSSNRRCPLEEPVKRTYQIHSRSKSPSVEKALAKIPDEKTSIGTFKCLTSRTTGLMQDIQDPSILIYFELEDLIGKDRKLTKGLTTWDAIKPMCNMAGVKVCYKAGKMNSETIGYAAHRNGLCLSIAAGKRLPKHLEYLDNVKLEKKHLRKTIDLPERMRRFKEAESNMQFPNRLKTTDQIRREDESERRPELIAVKGKVRVVLNESFSLLWGPIEECDKSEIQYYCLFDTYDLLVSGKQSAADKGVSMSSVVKVGDVLTYNACLMAKRKVVPYLATSVWNGEDRPFDVPPMAKANIQSDKIKVYEQVVESCMPFIEKREREEYAEENRMLETEGRRAKEEEIKRKARELRIMEQTEKEKREREAKELVQKPSPSPSGNEPKGLISVFDLLDWRTKGSIEAEKCDLFAILRLWNNKHALLSTHRVWINDKPKFGGWRALHLPYFMSQNVCARKVDGFEEFEYQVIFSHAGMYKKTGMTFDYPPAMAAWIKPLCIEQTLDAELNIYKTRHGTQVATLKDEENPPPPPGT